MASTVAARSSADLLVEHLDALRERDATEIHQGGDKASR